MSEAPERIWIEDEFGEGDEDQWTYGTWDVRNYRGYVVEYVRADTVQELTAERDSYRKALEDIIKDYEPGYPLSHDVIKYVARAALKGESHD